MALLHENPHIITIFWILISVGKHQLHH